MRHIHTCASARSQLHRCYNRKHAACCTSIHYADYAVLDKKSKKQKQQPAGNNRTIAKPHGVWKEGSKAGCVGDILSQSTIAVSIEVHPRFLVTDTNCFVDYLGAIELIAKAHPLYQLMVPIIVINELEGLSKGLRNQSPKQQAASTAAVADILVPVQKQLALPTAPATVASIAPANSSSSTSAAGLHQQHAAKVADASKKALQFIKSRNPALKCVTTKGSILKTSTFTVEDDVGDLKSNDDRILETALNLCRNHIEETRAGTRYLTMDVVLLTTDRNLRVKAISNDLPVREIPDFIKWAGLSA
uniref:PINc domain-containing protein n=1 Tax=Anopheles merus TaxID=30066 RepID=A0A182UVA3_ANOME